MGLLLVHSWTRRGHMCRPFSPAPARAFIFIAHRDHFPLLVDFQSKVAMSSYRAFRYYSVPPTNLMLGIGKKMLLILGL